MLGKTVFITTFMLGLAGCGTNDSQPKEKINPLSRLDKLALTAATPTPEVIEAVQQFEQICKVDVQAPILLVKQRALNAAMLTNGILGYTEDNKRVFISEEITGLQLKYLVWHELGHYQLHLGHTENPYDLMYGIDNTPETETELVQMLENACPQKI